MQRGDEVGDLGGGEKGREEEKEREKRVMPNGTGV